MLANLEGQVGRVGDDPDTDGEVRLVWADGSKSDWTKVTRLERATSAEEQGYAAARGAADAEEEASRKAAEKPAPKVADAHDGPPPEWRA